MSFKFNKSDAIVSGFGGIWSLLFDEYICKSFNKSTIPWKYSIWSGIGLSIVSFNDFFNDSTNSFLDLCDPSCPSVKKIILIII